MGDFDRNDNSPKPNETKKLVVVLALGVVLIVLVAMQFMKGGAPQAAVGSPVGNGMALPPPILSDEISPQSLATMLGDLQNDPTAPLLRTGARGGGPLNTPPRNPFRMNGDWYHSLQRQDPVQPVVATRPDPVPVYVPPHLPDPTPTPTVLKAADYKLTGILNGTTAVINGRIVKVGDIVGQARVLEVRDNGVRLQAADSPEGPTLLLSMGTSLGQ
jgi:hypothetical protein